MFKHQKTQRGIQSAGLSNVRRNNTIFQEEFFFHFYQISSNIKHIRAENCKKSEIIQFFIYFVADFVSVIISSERLEYFLKFSMYIRTFKNRDNKIILAITIIFVATAVKFFLIPSKCNDHFFFDNK